MKALRTLLLGGTCLLGLATESKADFWGDVARGARNFDQNRLDYMTPRGHYRAGRDYTKFYVHNRSSAPVWVSLTYYNNLGEYVSGYGTDYWSTTQWYHLAPGQRIHAANVTGRYVDVKFSNGSQYQADIGSYHSRSFTFNRW